MIEYLNRFILIIQQYASMVSFIYVSLLFIIVDLCLKKMDFIMN